MRFVRTLLAGATLAAASLSALAANPVVEMKTSMGTIKLELYPDKAPKTVDNFIEYVKSGQYKGTVFHRVIPHFMIQGGGLTADLKEKPTRAPIKNEADNGLKNDTGTIAMARMADPDSASAQFFINVNDNVFLNHGARDFGYAVFGKVVEGMDVVRKIEVVPTASDVPLKPVVIESVSLIDAAPAAKKAPAKK
ncbi:peptidylprolyl isomerase [Chitinivorax sp. PXF-14]|uniref:peptidylprolyl isomerase n=1 Tax=Chitinivorax sp. PXF-14 TaxID=3230488 RepID=UPI003466789D